MNAVQEVQVRVTQLLDQHQRADVLEQAGDESLVAGVLPVALAQLAGRHRLQQGVLPVAPECLRFDTGEQAFGQTESQGHQFERFHPQACECLLQVGYLPGQAEQGAVHDAEQLARQGRIAFHAGLQGPRVDARFGRQFQHLHRHRWQRIQLASTRDELLEQVGRHSLFDHQSGFLPRSGSAEYRRGDGSTQTYLTIRTDERSRPKRSESAGWRDR